MSYVLGYGFHVIPLERAIIRVGQNYYDPVWSQENESRFVSVWELSVDQLIEFVAANNKPPDFYDWIKAVA